MMYTFLNLLSITVSHAQIYEPDFLYLIIYLIHMPPVDIKNSDDDRMKTVRLSNVFQPFSLIQPLLEYRNELS